MNDPIISVSEFVALLNQTFEYAYPNITITGEVANFRISKNKWVYFDLKDDEAVMRFFGTVYQLPGPLEDGMMLAVRGIPKLHPQYGLSVTIHSLRPVGEGSIKKASKLLEAKLAAEGLFDEERKRPLPYPPKHIGLVTSGESAAYRDFIKIIQARWSGILITLIDVQVQGDVSPMQVAAAIGQFNQMAHPPDVIVVTRGGGSSEDLQAFSTEQVTRAVAASRIPTLVAIGHEVDISLAELAADRRASTPSNAAELLVPDRKHVLGALRQHKLQLIQGAKRSIHNTKRELMLAGQTLKGSVLQIAAQANDQLQLRSRLLDAFDPKAPLRRGYVLLRKDGQIIKDSRKLSAGDDLQLELIDARLTTTLKSITMKAGDNNDAKS